MKFNFSMENRRNVIIFIAVLIAVILAAAVLAGGFSGQSRSMSATRLRCVPSQDIKPFGDKILYYDGVMLFCLSSNGNERWSYTLGENASYFCNDKYITAWSGSQLHIIDQNGSSTYNENLADNIQFAKPGTKYVAVVLGNDASPSLLIKDLQGTTVDNETAAYEDMVILDVGFFDNGEYLWTTSLDIYATVPDIILHSYRINMTSSGEISLGDSLAYAILFANGKLNVITTDQLRRFDYRGTEDADAEVLLYGWQLCDSSINGNDFRLLFSLTNNNGIEGITQLRLLAGKIDKRLSLPSVCVGAALYNKRVYAFARDTVYRAEINDQRFTTHGLPRGMDNKSVTSYLGMLSNGVALLACGDEVYAVVLP